MELSVFIISGNHDSGERLSFGARIMENDRVYFSGVFDGKMKKVETLDETERGDNGFGSTGR